MTVARLHSEGALRASFERLAATVAHNSAYRTAMIAAIIVLSAPAASGAPLQVAGARMLGVSLGAVIGALVSVCILPSRREVLVARRVAKPATKGPATAMVKFIAQMHADIAFLERELQTDEPPPAVVITALQDFARTFEAAATKVAALARGRPCTTLDAQPLRDECRNAAQSLRDQCPNSEGSRLMLRRLLEDFSALIRSIERAGIA